MSIEFKRTEHSDILVHWTGSDIDKNDSRMQETKKVAWRKHALRPIDRPSLIKRTDILDKYLRRLRDILKFGFWMKVDQSLSNNGALGYKQEDGRVENTPNVARICFTELKLSEARQHAYEYGRLGIGVKRMFLFDRAGQPMVYVNPKKNASKPNWFIDSPEIANEDTLWSITRKSFLKYTSEIEDLNYKYLAESEWRIAYPDGLDVNTTMGRALSGLIINIDGDLNVEFSKYKMKSCSLGEFREFIRLNKSRGLKYLLPLDYWLAVIIYPCPAVKIAAERNCEIRRLLRKTRIPLGQSLIDIGIGERHMMPIEIDLDTMSHF